jgi:hypothetical protein
LLCCQSAAVSITLMRCTSLRASLVVLRSCEKNWWNKLHIDSAPLKTSSLILAGVGVATLNSSTSEYKSFKLCFHGDVMFQQSSSLSDHWEVALVTFPVPRASAAATGSKADGSGEESKRAGEEAGAHTENTDKDATATDTAATAKAATATAATATVATATATAEATGITAKLFLVGSKCDAAALLIKPSGKYAPTMKWSQATESVTVAGCTNLVCKVNMLFLELDVDARDSE